MTINERAARAYLSHLTEPDDREVGQLLGVQSAADVLAKIAAHQVSENLLKRLIPRAVLGFDELKIQAWMMDQRDRHQVHVIIPGDPEWPERLSDLGAGAPHALWVKGNLNNLASLNDHGKYSVSIVGARAATSYGEHVAIDLTTALAEGGVITVSGGAYGIDNAVHMATIATGGITIMFSAGGVDRVYPAGNRGVQTRMLDRGARISEVPPESTPTRWRFLSRNRLIAAATQATVVVEAGWRSGSLNTADHAHQLGRPLGAVPGPITSAASAGCHRLLREFGATCITSADDVRDLIAPPVGDAWHRADVPGDELFTIKPGYQEVSP